MMLECRTAGEAVSLLKTVPLASNGDYVMCDSASILDVEATTGGTHAESSVATKLPGHTSEWFGRPRRGEYDQ